MKEELDFNELQNDIRDEILHYLVSGGADLSRKDQVQDALDSFYSDTIVDYMNRTGLQLGYEVKIDANDNIIVNVWEW